MTRSPDILFMAEYIKNVLYFATVRQGKTLKSTADTHYFCIDNDLIYENYYSDFGPLNLGCVYKYCRILNEKLKQHLNKQAIVHYTSIDPKKKANAAFVLGCYGVLYLSLSPRDALKPLLVHGQSYRPFQDATQGDSAYTISLIDCLNAIKKARDLGFFNFQDFNYEEYDRLDKIQGGDLNWIVPAKFLAFIGPVDCSVSLYHPPEMYIDYFLENDVKIVIRLNKRLYDGNVFNNAGITHYDLFFPDGSCPPRNILFKFLQISEESDCAIAVHCKAGLGRTGSLIGCYLIKHYRMTSHEAIGWMRICRPGSVIGHQQGWLEQLEPWLIKQGNVYRKRTYQDTEKIPTHEFGVYSIAEKAIKQRPVVFSKSPSPPPPMHRQTRSDITPPIRAQASRVREAFSKAPEKEPSEWRVRTPKTNISQKINYKSDQNNITRRGSGSGEPRPSSPPSRGSTARTQRNSAKSNDSTVRSIAGYQTPLPTFRTSQGPVIKTINDARNFLMRSSMNRDDRDRHLNSSVTVTPHYSRVSQYGGEHSTIGNMAHITPSSFSTASRGSTQPQHRRRLGRSPSPPQLRMVTEQTRATNTPSCAGKFLAKDASKTALKEVLSRLKLVTGRDGSIGAASVGAASLGARRDAPAPKRAPSVRSDERPLATQGDMLNSIKFQRRLRDSLHSEKLSGLVQEKISMTPKEKSSIKDVHSRTSTGTRPSLHHDTSGPKERTSTTSRGFFGPQRPSSPKGRRNSHASYY
ncbi:dual specificity protein phosphatase CDC14AB-like isoform X1 [Ostrinia nubilalis]|uniref:dual specificity protein phosphatase CDC14AB-like isoform X1 n=1 Tax=Ostrinia nubilalis TaxID=29057 RepID=UPI0030825D62